MKKKIILFITVLFAAFAFCGCQSEVYFYNYPGDESSTYLLEFVLNNSEVKALENSASKTGLKHDGSLNDFGYRYTEGKPWTVEEYITTVIEMRTNFEYYDRASDTEKTSLSFIFEAQHDEDTDDEEQEEEDDSSDVQIEKGFFMYHVRVEQDSVFNYYKELYYSDDSTDNSAIGVIKNGLVEYRSLDTKAENYEEQKQALLDKGFVDMSDGLFGRGLIPPFEKAFPLAVGNATYSAKLLKATYVLQTNNKLTTSGEKLRDTQGNRYYFFSSLFDEKQDKIVYEYVRANSVGWNVLTICLGLATVGILMLYCKFRKPKEPKKTTYAQAKERYPYDPYESIDPFAEYGGKDGKGSGNDKNNPFEGY